MNSLVWGHKVKDQCHSMTRYGQNTTLGVVQWRKHTELDNVHTIYLIVIIIRLTYISPDTSLADTLL